MNVQSFIVAASLALAGASGCMHGNDSSDVACTALFAIVNVDVVDANGAGVVGLTSRTVRVESGELVHAQVDNPTSWYTIADDNLTPFLDPEGDDFRFTLLSGGDEVAGIDVILSTDAYGCHIMASGVPDQIVVP